MENSFTFFTDDSHQTYERKYYTPDMVGMYILPSMYGVTVKDITYGQLDIITQMINNNWRLCPGFFCVEDENGVKKLKPNLNWFVMYCDDDGFLFQYTCHVDYETNNVTLYNTDRMIAKYATIDDMYECMPRLLKTQPIKCVGCDIDGLSENLTAFYHYNFDGEIFKKENKVYENIHITNLMVELDKEKCNKITIKGNA